MSLKRFRRASNFLAPFPKALTFWFFCVKTKEQSIKQSIN